MREKVNIEHENSAKNLVSFPFDLSEAARVCGRKKYIEKIWTYFLFSSAVAEDIRMFFWYERAIFCELETVKTYKSFWNWIGNGKKLCALLREYVEDSEGGCRILRCKLSGAWKYERFFFIFKKFFHFSRSTFYRLKPFNTSLRRWWKIEIKI